MQIYWNENPLETSIEVTDAEKTFMYYALIYDKYLWAADTLNPEHELFQKRINEILEFDRDDIVDFYVKELKYGVHIGDCTCRACSCSKCRAEDALGVYTLHGLWPSKAVKIEEAFARDDVNTAQECVEFLKQEPEYTRPETWPDGIDYESHISRWKKERTEAAIWMEKYIKEKLS